ncbi:MAG: alpha-L-fucosidase [Lachnospiraceae bacterium]|nr:alpha-L-fucosidase [Lachnospiraceae bacterium]
MREETRQWFRDAKYGLFIHWGLYSILAGEYRGVKTDKVAEWILNYMDIPVEEYRELVHQFSPDQFNADEIVRKAKEDWGMQYLVFTTKHHEGFAMYDSKVSGYNVVKATPYGKDVLREIREACDKYGMKLGLYYSQAQDWDDPDGYRNHADNSKKNFRRYFDEKVKPQVAELLTNYGEICLIWFDTPMEMTYEETKELADLVHGLQPECLLSGRTGHGLGDYRTSGDNFLPALPCGELWEAPATLNDTWGYSKHDHNWKSPEDVLRLLLRITARGGNYLLNIGPRGDGSVPEESVAVLDAVGRYVTANREAIFGTQPVDPIYPYELDWALLTRRPHKIYIHVLRPRKHATLLGVANRVTRATLVEDGRELEVSCTMTTEGDSRVRVFFPEDLTGRADFAVCLETEEADPVFEPFAG